MLDSKINWKIPAVIINTSRKEHKMKKIVFITSCFFVISLVSVCLALEGNIEKGKKLFSDPKLAESTKNLACINCHTEKDTFKSIPEGKELNFLINRCIAEHMEGLGLSHESQEMKDLKSYIISRKK